ncbi:uncharacterized protein LOC133741951 [Rosa rugosa]|uniref:uncharacterized protein LOC133741951 n=1 Tax=Rosa rugosa TaxID=74645 RepID=UPI002B40B6D2|nr:uncharacterized protein LOC133741951 [Rosa rugosa]
MPKYSRQYVTEVDWGSIPSPRMNCTLGPPDVLQIQFNFHAPPGRGDRYGEFLDYDSEPPRVLRLRHADLPTICNLIWDILTSFFNLRSTSNKSDFTSRRITEVLKSMPLAEEVHPVIVDKILGLLPVTTLLIPNSNFIQVDIFDVTWMSMARNPESAVMIWFENISKRRAKHGAWRAEQLQNVRLDRSCPICMEDFDFDDGLIATRLPCLHIFHRHCILRWLETNYKCPLCRYPSPHY